MPMIGPVGPLGTMREAPQSLDDATTGPFPFMWYLYNMLSDALGKSPEGFNLGQMPMGPGGAPSPRKVTGYTFPKYHIERRRFGNEMIHEQPTMKETQYRPFDTPRGRFQMTLENVGASQGRTGGSIPPEQVGKRLHPENLQPYRIQHGAMSAHPDINIPGVEAQGAREAGRVEWSNVMDTLAKILGMGVK